jgi:uncharacterized protein YbdZ (MbtH family)
LLPYEGCTSDTQSSNEAEPKQLIHDKEAINPGWRGVGEVTSKAACVAVLV